MNLGINYNGDATSFATFSVCVCVCDFLHLTLDNSSTTHPSPNSRSVLVCTVYNKLLDKLYFVGAYLVSFLPPCVYLSIHWSSVLACAAFPW